MSLTAAEIRSRVYQFLEVSQTSVPPATITEWIKRSVQEMSKLLDYNESLWAFFSPLVKSTTKQLDETYVIETPTGFLCLKSGSLCGRPVVKIIQQQSLSMVADMIKQPDFGEIWIVIKETDGEPDWTIYPKLKVFQKKTCTINYLSEPTGEEAYTEEFAELLVNKVCVFGAEALQQYTKMQVAESNYNKALAVLLNK